MVMMMAILAMMAMIIMEMARTVILRLGAVHILCQPLEGEGGKPKDDYC